MVNAHNGEISLYDPSGRLQGRIESETLTPGITLEAIAHYQGRLLAKGRGSRVRGNSLVVINEKFDPIHPSALAKPGNLESVRNLYSGWIINGAEIVAYGSMAASNNRGFQLGFLKVDLSSGAAKMVLPFDRNDYYLVNHQYIAAANGDSYFLVMNETPKIYRLSKNRPAVPLGRQSIPAAYRRVQLPKAKLSREAAKSSFEELEGLKIPVGLYGQGQFIYLLTRDPNSLAKVWSLYKIDARSGRLMGSITLPSLARHLTLVPGDQHWLIIEKGVVESADQQEIKSLQSVPATWITQTETSPLQRPADFNRCLRGN